MQSHSKKNQLSCTRNSTNSKNFIIYKMIKLFDMSKELIYLSAYVPHDLT